MDRQQPENRAAIYCRVSSSGQETDGSSLQTQEAKCREYAAQRDYSVDEAHVYREVYSGTELWNRPQLTRLRDAVRSGAVNVVIAYDIDRLSREPVHLGVILSEADHVGVGVEFVTEVLDHSPEGQLIRFVRGYAAKVEHEKIKERTMRGKLARVQSGKLLPNGRPLYGYRWRDASKGALDIEETTAPIVRRIYRDIASGKTLRRLATELTQESVPTPSGRGTMWYGSALQVILHNPAYKGQAYAWGLRRSAKGQPQMFDPSRAIALPEGTIPAIVDPVVWDSVQEILTRNQQRAIRNARNPEAALLRGGFGTCGYCGATLSARPRSNGAYDYVCGSHRYSIVRHCPCPTIVTHNLDQAVWTYVTEVITQPDVVARELARLHEHDPSDDDLAAIDRASASVKRQQGNVARAIALMNDDEGVGPLVAQLEELNQRVKKLDEERRVVEQRRVSWEQAQKQLENLEAWRQRVAKNLDTLTYEGRRRALDALGIHVTLYSADHEPRYIITASIPFDAGVAYSTT